MVRVTKTSENYFYACQDIDEKQAILADMANHPKDYLSHADSVVRCLADWTMEIYGIRVTRAICRHDGSGSEYLHKLYKRLREV